MRVLLVSMVALMLALAIGCKSRESTVQGEGGAKLTLEKPGDVTVTRGDTETIDVSIERKNLAGPVAVKFANLPSGVTVIDGDKQIEGEKGTYNLQASADADMVSNHEAQVTVRGPEGVATTQTFRITVKEKS